MADSIRFEPDERVEKIAHRAAKQVTRAVKSLFDVTLDGSEASIESVDGILNRLHSEKALGLDAPTAALAFLPKQIRSRVGPGSNFRQVKAKLHQMIRHAGCAPP